MSPDGPAPSPIRPAAKQVGARPRLWLQRWKQRPGLASLWFLDGRRERRPVSATAWTLTWVAGGAAALFAGGALYVSLVEHPARLATGPPMAVAQFRTSYPRGSPAPGRAGAPGDPRGRRRLARRRADRAGSGPACSSAWSSRTRWWSSSRPTSASSTAPCPPTRPRRAGSSARWTALHAVRTLLGLAAAAAMAHLLAHG